MNEDISKDLKELELKNCKSIKLNKKLPSSIEKLEITLQDVESIKYIPNENLKDENLQIIFNN